MLGTVVQSKPDMDVEVAAEASTAAEAASSWCAVSQPCCSHQSRVQQLQQQVGGCLHQRVATVCVACVAFELLLLPSQALKLQVQWWWAAPVTCGPSPLPSPLQIAALQIASTHKVNL